MPSVSRRVVGALLRGHLVRLPHPPFWVGVSHPVWGGGGGGGGGVVPLLAVASGPSTIALLVVDKPECLWRRRVAACRVLCGAMAGSSPALMVWVNCSNWACLQMVL